MAIFPFYFFYFAKIPTTLFTSQSTNLTTLQVTRIFTIQYMAQISKYGGDLKFMYFCFNDQNALNE